MAKRLIDSAELIAKLPVVDDDKQISLIGAVADVMVMITECQTVDAVEVVMCSRCRHGDKMEDGGIYCHLVRDCRNTDDFCSYGERKER